MQATGCGIRRPNTVNDGERAHSATSITAGRGRLTSASRRLPISGRSARAHNGAETGVGGGAADAEGVCAAGHRVSASRFRIQP
eukprot:scaffold336_cov250-Pinguiococcus_pyrenoidosus.AAC.19